MTRTRCDPNGARPLRIGTRGSPLALWQARWVRDRLQPLIAPRAIELVSIRTTGDERPHDPLPSLGGIGVFTKEIQRALLAGEIDVGVHSLKDLPTIPVAGLVIAAVPVRASADDVLISRAGETFDGLPAGAVIGTSSPRRAAQVLIRRADLRTADLRGNVENRIRELDRGRFEAIILARAGLERLGFAGRITEDLAWMLPAIGQGALALECRRDDQETVDILHAIDDDIAHEQTAAERGFLARLGGGCLMPIGARASTQGDRLTLEGGVFGPAAAGSLRGTLAGSRGQAQAIGVELARALLERGADRLLSIPGAPPPDKLE